MKSTNQSGHEGTRVFRPLKRNRDRWLHIVQWTIHFSYMNFVFHFSFFAASKMQFCKVNFPMVRAAKFKSKPATRSNEI